MLQMFVLALVVYKGERKSFSYSRNRIMNGINGTGSLRAYHLSSRATSLAVVHLIDLMGHRHLNLGQGAFLVLSPV